MPTTISSKKRRLFYASNTSAAFCAVLCAALESQGETLDVLMLQSDFHSGTNLQEYETVMQALSSDYNWANVGFCNGVSRTLEYAGRIEPFNSRITRTYADIKDAWRVDQCVRELFQAVDPELSSRQQNFVDEIWVDSPVLVPLFLYAKHRKARKVLFPHTPVVLWGEDTPYFPLPNAGARKGQGFPGKHIRKLLTATLPLGLAIKFNDWAFDKAYTLRDKDYLAREVVNLHPYLTKKALQKAFDCLPKEAQEYYKSMNPPDDGHCPSVLFLTTGGEGPQYLDKEISALIHLLNATRDVRSDGAIILKPHPRGRADYIRRVANELQQQFPTSKFKVIDRWGSVPIEIAASKWTTTCGLGLFTDALFSMRMLLDVPVYCPAQLLREMYEKDPFMKFELVRFLQSGSNIIDLV